MSKKAYSVLQLSQNETLAKLLCPDPPRACLDDGCPGSVTVSASLKNSPALFCVGPRTYFFIKFPFSRKNRNSKFEYFQIFNFIKVH